MAMMELCVGEGAPFYAGQPVCVDGVVAGICWGEYRDEAGRRVVRVEVADDALAQVSDDLTRRAATCPRCAGPAVALLTSVRCERAGGCRTLEERIGEPVVRFVAARRCDGIVTDEEQWIASSPLATRGGPTRDHALAAWREKAMEAAK
jgi:hypothetical protein